jgi:gliding motility-associated lipoprotein GldH
MNKTRISLFKSIGVLVTFHRGLFFCVLFSSLVACDPARVYETNSDFDNAMWLVGDTAKFEFAIEDAAMTYNVILNLRNSLDFETARLFVNYSLRDSTAIPLRKRLVEQNLFDIRTGEPFGESGLGNIYEHRIIVEPKIKFPTKGKYTAKISQMMRTDTLREILSVGIRVERAGL